QFVMAADDVLKDGAVLRSRRELLKRSFHLNSQMAPKLFAIGDNCKATLDLKVDIDFYVHPAQDFLASAYVPSNDERICILLSARMIEKFDDDELAFVVGHQIGHLLFDHHRMPINMLLERAGELLSPVHALRVYAWKRNAEISADRVGMLCCQSFDAAASALFKLATGLPAERLAFHLRDYLDAFRDLKHELIHGRQDELEDWYSGHGFTPVRLRALELFHKSKTFNWLLDREGGYFEDESLENDISEFVELMEPHYLSEHNDVSQVVREFIFIGSHLVALAKGPVGKTDLEGLATLLDPEIMQRALGKVDGASEEAVWQAQREAAEELNRKLPPVNKLNLLKDLTIISYSIGGKLEEAQADVLYRMSQLLKIQPEFIDRVLASAAGPLD
ncbi:MAG TPA: M48 family metallopeptidase, partial [Bdellovibrionota bacterium]|nr:M48 family metallopeptidase [Bdellovibrionota bacterium]